MRVRDDLLFGVTQGTQDARVYISTYASPIFMAERSGYCHVSHWQSFLEMTVIIFAYFFLARPIHESMPNLRELGKENFTLHLGGGMWEYLWAVLMTTMGFPHSSVGKESTCNAGHPGLIPGKGRSAREGKGYALQYSGLENSMGCIVHGVAESDITEWVSLSLSMITTALKYKAWYYYGQTVNEESIHKWFIHALLLYDRASKIFFG